MTGIPTHSRMSGMVASCRYVACTTNAASKTGFRAAGVLSIRLESAI
jgi:hypothetical protein